MATTNDLRHGAHLVRRDGREATYLAPSRWRADRIEVWTNNSTTMWATTDVARFQNIECYEPMQEVSDG